jgi:transcription elongation factor GreA
MADEGVFLTKQGLNALKDELEELRTSGRAAVAEAIREAQELGPDQQDAQYEDAKNQQAFLEGRIREIELTLERAVEIDERAAHRSKEVRLGSKVTLKTEDGKSHKYQLVGPAEADPLSGRISHESPVGRALLGKKRGETVTVNAPAGDMEMTVTTVS